MNQEYTIKKVENENIIIEDICLTKNIIKKHFTLPYCWTAHSAQGITIPEKYIIYDYRSQHVDLKWLYVSITRCNDLNNVYFYTGQLNDLNNEKEKINKMILNYKTQDFNADREIIDEKYINYNWLIKQLNKQKSKCYHCDNIIEISTDSLQEKLTVDRINSEKSHYKDNSVLSCMHCNVSLKNKQKN